MNERAVRLGSDRRLIAIHTPVPRPPADGLGVIVLNSGLVHRPGPARLSVHLARALAAAGRACIRFDYSGVGDSPPRRDGLPVLAMAAEEPITVLDACCARFGWRGAVLTGVCAGAYGAWLAAEDARIAGIALINPMSLIGEGGDEKVANDARFRHYLGRSLWRGQAWRNLLTGKVDYRRLAGTLVGAVRRIGGGHRDGDGDGDGTLAALHRRREGLLARDCRVLVAHAEHDPYQALTRRCFPDVWSAEPPRHDGDACQRWTIPDADHLFLRPDDRRRLIDGLLAWLPPVPVPADDDEVLVL